MGIPFTIDIANCNGCCSNVTANLTIACATKGGTAALVGYPEFVPSSPPDLYRRKDFSSTLINCDGPLHTPATCATTSTVGRSDVNGFCQVNASTGAETNSTTSNSKSVSTSSCADPGIGTSTGTIPCSTVPVGKDIAPTSALDPTVLTATTLRGVSRSDCYNTPTNDRKWIAGGFYNIDLSDKDLESDAISRLMANTSFGAFTNANFAANCIGSHCCLAQYEARTVNTNFAYQISNVRMTLTGLTPLANYCVQFDIYRSVYGAANYTPFATILTTAQTAANGNWQDYHLIDSPGRGFQYLVAAARAASEPC